MGIFCTSMGLLFSVFSQSRPLQEPPSGTCSIQLTGEDRFSIWANEAPVDAVIRDLGRLHGAEIRVHISPDDVRTFRYLNVDLVDAMDRLNIDYSLNYIRDEAGEALLSGGNAGHLEDGIPEKHPWLPLPTGPEAETVKALIAELRDDDVRWNYEEAITALYSLEHQAVAIPFLEQALVEGDWQQMSGAYQVLRGYAEGWTGRKVYTEPSQTFLDITVKGMKDDYLLRDKPDQAPRPSHSATYGLNYFVRNKGRVEAVEPLLSQALYQQDKQFRFLSATVLGGAGRTSNARRLVEILAPQLQDNQTSRDSVMAIYGLSGLGPVAEPYLLSFESAADEQAVRLLKTVRSNWSNPTWQTNYPYLRSTYWEQSDFADLPGD